MSKNLSSVEMARESSDNIGIENRTTERYDVNLNGEKDERKELNASSSARFSKCIWNKKVPNTEIEKFQKIIEKKYNLHFDSYWEFHRWTCDNFPQYWKEIWDYLDVIYSKDYEEVYKKTGEGFLDCEWFTGAAFNFAENVLRIKDDTMALIYIDEEGNEEFVTYAQMFEEVKLYAAAFKKHGLQVGDRVASYMSNRKEAIFAYLAAASIGAIFGGAQPYFAAKPACKAIRKIEPKFLISIDHHIESGHLNSNINNLSEIAYNTPSLEKVIIVPSYPETKTRNLSDIKNSCLLEDFLKSGRTPDGDVPEIEFEQLPFSHPLCITFTSGTTGDPKGLVHSAGTFITNLASQLFSWNMQSGDVVLQFYPPGWSPWDSFFPCLAKGITLLLYSGYAPFGMQGANIWDTCSQYKVAYTFMTPGMVHGLERSNIVPGPQCNLEHLRFINIGGSPVKVQHCMYLLNKVKKDMFVCVLYGGSEIFGNFSGSNLNLPCYAPEAQGPGLGTDVRCFDEKGNSVVNKRGEMVITKPTPALLTCIWKDEGNKFLKECYLSKFPDVWCQNDEIWIHPLTNGIIVIGRSDDVLINHGTRFSAADIYIAIHDMEEIQDSIVVSQTRDDGEYRVVLFVQMKEGYPFTQHTKEKIAQKIWDGLWDDCIPDVILDTKGIPYNHNNKKTESIIRKIVATNKIPESVNIKNPDCLKYYVDIPELVQF